VCNGPDGGFLLGQTMSVSKRRKPATDQMAFDLKDEDPRDEDPKNEPEEPEERWLPVVGWEGYDVSDLGRVRSWWNRKARLCLNREPRIRKLTLHVEGYMHVGLSSNRIQRGHKVHRLVLEAFVGPCPEGMQCRHLDGNPSNNRLENLCWGTPIENWDDKVRHGTRTREKLVEREPIMFADPFIPLEALLPFEVWKEVSGHPGYEISNFGRARSYWGLGLQKMRDEPKVLTPAFINEYPVVGMNAGSNRPPRALYIHRLVLMAFSPCESEGLVCRHVDGNRKNPHISNLKWGTQAENVRDAIHHGTLRRGEHHGRSKLSDEKVLEIGRRLAAGEQGASLAREYGVGASTVCRIRHDRRKLSRDNT
jgi:hypothetical protein